MAKKLQVFVSSTYKDLLAERQAVVEAILRAGHIPAGMELFAAGDKSQLEIIKQWIEESDVFMLILGGRYGSVERDSGKSYTQLEYEYAGSINKPYFAAIADDAYLNEKVRKETKDVKDVFEQDHPVEYKQFKEQVASKICRFFTNSEQLKVILFESLSDVLRQRDKDLVGWVRANEATNVGPLVDQIGQLQKENERLKDELAGIKAQAPAEERYNGYAFDELYSRLAQDTLEVPETYRQRFGWPEKVDLLATFWKFRERFAVGVDPGHRTEFTSFLAYNLAPPLSLFGLVESTGTILKASREGIAFLARIDREKVQPQIELAASDEGPPPSRRAVTVPAKRQ